MGTAALFSRKNCIQIVNNFLDSIGFLTYSKAKRHYTVVMLIPVEKMTATLPVKIKDTNN